MTVELNEQEIMKIVKKYMNIDGIVYDVKKQALHDMQEVLNSQRPEILIDFNIIYKELTMMMNEFRKTVNEVEKKTKKLFESSTLTEDVYKMRDEMKVIKKKLDKVNRGFKMFAKFANFTDLEKDED